MAKCGGKGRGKGGGKGKGEGKDRSRYLGPVALSVGLFLLTGCLGFELYSKPIADIGTVIAAKALGEKLGNDGFKWSGAMDKFIAMVQNDGITLDSATVLSAYIDDTISPLYRDDCKNLLGAVGLRFKAGSPIDVSEFNTALFLQMATAFKQGVEYGNTQHTNSTLGMSPAYTK